MNDKTTTDIISTTGINITKYDILPAKVFINGVEVTDTESWNKAISTFSELENKINNLQSKIDKAIEYIEKDTRWFDSEYASVYGELCDCEGYNTNRLEVMVNPSNLLKILKENNYDKCL